MKMHNTSDKCANLLQLILVKRERSWMSAGAPSFTETKLSHGYLNAITWSHLQQKKQYVLSVAQQDK